MKKFLLIASIVLAFALALFIYIRYFFVFGEGVRNGELNYVVRKGVIFKTYEGKLIQTGIKSQKGGNGIQSNTFDFSIIDRELAEELMKCSGRTLELHYREYFHALPWRGHSKYVVDEIVSSGPKDGKIEDSVLEGISAE